MSDVTSAGAYKIIRPNANTPPSGLEPELTTPSGQRGSEPFDPASSADAHVKRFFEVWLADKSFRQASLDDARQTAKSRGLRVDPLEVRYLWDDRYRAELAQSGRNIEQIIRAAPEPTQRLFAWIRFSHERRDQMRNECSPSDSRFRAWRDRQIARSLTTFRRTYELYTPHVLFAIELGKGCSVGCWFCGVSAPKLEAQFPHTPENRRLFRDTLSSLRNFTGPMAGGWGFLYWATDPFDNPDYEKFCIDFQDIFGRFPTTTTAQPLRDPRRTRSFLQLAASREPTKVRFSVLTLRMLEKIFEEFTAEELARADIIPINKGSLVRASASGRAREQYLRRGGEELKWAETAADTSIACVSGFLINMVEKTVKLISPCPASQKWPLGYYVYDKSPFASGEDLHSALDRMIKLHMPLTAPEEKVLRFRPDFSYRGTDDGFILDARYGREIVSDNPLLRDLGDAVGSGARTPHELANELADDYGLDEAIPLAWIDRLFARGLFDEEPASGHPR